MTLLESKSLTEAAKIVFGIDYYNGKIKRRLLAECKSRYGIDIEEIVRNNNKSICLNCGKIIPKHRKFCSQSCAASYNNRNRGGLSNETKQKISETLIKANSEKKSNLGGVRNEAAKRYEYAHICKKCGKTFFTAKKNQKFCSVKCAQGSETTKEILRSKMKDKVANGEHSGWKSRVVKSYAEKFWESVLLNNNIEFIREDFSTKKYFLDFLIEKNGKKIDLEIDGKQHERKERADHDMVRDQFLKEKGFVVYRIKWNSINTADGKRAMEKKISNFLKFLETV